MPYSAVMAGAVERLVEQAIKLPTESGARLTTRMLDQHIEVTAAWRQWEATRAPRCSTSPKVTVAAAKGAHPLRPTLTPGPTRLYIVHVKRYTAAQARQNLSHVLDAAEKGESVVIERRGVRFCVRQERVPRGRPRGSLRIESLDPAVAEGRWTWEPGRSGLRFRRRCR